LPVLLVLPVPHLLLASLKVNQNRMANPKVVPKAVLLVKLRMVLKPLALLNHKLRVMLMVVPKLPELQRLLANLEVTPNLKLAKQ
jgi:hypothetical protein